MIKTFVIAVSLLSTINAASENNLEHANLCANKIIEHLDGKFPHTHVFSFSEVSFAIQTFFPDIDSTSARRLQLDIVMVYLNRK